MPHTNNPSGPQLRVELSPEQNGPHMPSETARLEGLSVKTARPDGFFGREDTVHVKLTATSGAGM